MKSKLLIFILFAIPVVASAQEPPQKDPYIEVTGRADIEIEPNEIFLLIRLKEFEENRQKTALEQLDKDFLNALKQAGIDRSRLELADVGSSLDKIRKKEKDAFREKTYQLKLTSATELEKVIVSLEPVKVDFVDIIRLSHSDIEKINLDLKVRALQAAKAKAELLAKSIGASVGKPLMVREWEFEARPMDMMANVRMQSFDADQQQQPTAFRKIKLQSQITAQFEIK